MDRFKIYSASDWGETRRVLAGEGFKIVSGLPGIMEYPDLKSNGYADPSGTSVGINGFRVLTEPITKAENTGPGGILENNLAESFDYHEVQKFHLKTHELPNSIITADMGSMTRFISGVDLPEDKFGDKNPFYEAIQNLEKAVGFYAGQLYCEVQSIMSNSPTLPLAH